MDATLKTKTELPLEYGLKVGKNSNGTYSFSNLVEGTPSSTPLNNAILPSGNYLADGHSHAGGFGDPSAGDFYGMLNQLTTNDFFQYRFVYGNDFGTPEVYALILTNKYLAMTFLSTYPQNQNYNENSHSFLESSSVGTDFFQANNYANAGTFVNETNEFYNSGALAMAYILDKYNTGISLAKVDASGNLKKLIVTKESIKVPGGTGTPKPGLKVTKCP